MLPSSDDRGLGLRVYILSGPPVRSLSLRPGDSLTIPRMAFVDGLQIIRFPSCLPSKLRGSWLLPRWVLSPTERASLRWSHYRSCVLTSSFLAGKITSSLRLSPVWAVLKTGDLPPWQSIHNRPPIGFGDSRRAAVAFQRRIRGPGEAANSPGCCNLSCWRIGHC